MVILEEGNPPHPRYPRYDMLVPWVELNVRHTTNGQCAKGVEQKRHRLMADKMREITARSLHAYSRLLNSVTSFKYLGRIMTPSDDYWPMVVGILRKARKSWERLSRILGRDGANLRVSGIFQGGGAGGTAYWVGDMGDDSPHVPGTGGVSAQGIHTDHWEASPEVIGRDLGVPTIRDGDAGGGV